jgi:hypothetical protein
MHQQAYKFDTNHTADILNCLRKAGCKLNDIAVMNILYLLHELREPVGLQIVDSIFIEHAHKKERSISHLNRAIDTEIARSLHINVILFPLFKRRHWSLLVFIPSLKGYVHFDSFEDLEHSLYASLLVRLIDSKDEYHQLALPQACTQQKYDWECGYFLLMTAYMMIDMKVEHLESEETLRYYMKRQMSSITQHNVFRFIEKLDTIISDL